jgi:hypothetical protein
MTWLIAMLHGLGIKIYQQRVWRKHEAECRKLEAEYARHEGARAMMGHRETLKGGDEVDAVYHWRGRRAGKRRVIKRKMAKRARYDAKAKLQGSVS